jgi:hypothetical protein
MDNSICDNNKNYSSYNSSIPNSVDNIASVSFAPFLMWNNHENKYFENIGKINKLAIDSNDYKQKQCIENNITGESLNDDEDYEDIMRNAFFSKDNIEYIQKMIIIKVYEDSDKQYRLRPQKYHNIIQIMNGIYDTYCRHLPYNLKEQINELDNKVIEYCSKLLLEETKVYYNYLRDIEPNKLDLLARPEYNSSRKTLPSNKFNLN